ncbi:MAG: hypothetical protein IPK80_15835 [Nannocystis sp.]|nr:hypothetical protein [Nannocystis sp.]
MDPQRGHGGDRRGDPGDAWDERGNMIAPWDEHLDAWADAWIAVAGDSPKPSPPPPSQAAASPATPTTEPAAEPPNDVIRLSDGAKARRAKAEAEEIARIERIAGNDAGLRDLALQLGKLADPIEKTPREIAWWFRAEGNRHIANIIESYLEEGGPFGRLLEDIAEDLRETSEEHDVDARDGRLIVSPDAILKDDHGEYVLREDREGVSRRYIVRVSPIVDKDGDQVAVQIRDTDQARSEGEPLQGGDHLLSFYFTRLTEAAIREHWRHFGMLAKALRRGPMEIERTRQLLVYAAVLVRAPSVEATPAPPPNAPWRSRSASTNGRPRPSKSTSTSTSSASPASPATSPASPTPSLKAAPKARPCSRSPTSPPPTTSTPSSTSPPHPNRQASKKTAMCTAPSTPPSNQPLIGP